MVWQRESLSGSSRAPGRSPHRGILRKDVRQVRDRGWATGIDKLQHRSYRYRVMRQLLAFLAVFALLISPVTAAAAQRVCARADAEARTNMPAAAGMHADIASCDPCCDQATKAAHRNKSCAQACASTCVVSLTAPVIGLGAPLFQTTQVFAVVVQTLRAHAPPQADRPPKHIA